MAPRLRLQADLEKILGSRNVYFQPSEKIQMAYPAIVYHRDVDKTEFANNLPYSNEYRYTVTLISRDPDEDEVLNKLRRLPKCLYSRGFRVEGLNHDTFNLYY